MDGEDFLAKVLTGDEILNMAGEFAEHGLKVIKASLRPLNSVSDALVQSFTVLA
jgi:hypothetical protein